MPVLRQVITSQRSRLAVACVLFVSHQVGEVSVPVVAGLVIDRAVVTGDGAALGRWLAVLAGVFAVLSTSWRWADRILTQALEEATLDLRLRLVDRVTDHRGLAGPWPTGQLVSVASSDAAAAARVLRAVAAGGAAGGAIVVSAVFLLLVSVPLGFVIVVGLPPLLVVVHRLAAPIERHFVVQQAYVATAAATATDLLRGIRVLKGIGAETEAAGRYRRASRRSLAASLRATRLFAGHGGMSVAATGVFVASVALVGGRLAAGGRIGVNELVAAVGVTQFLVGPLGRVGFAAAELATARASAHRVAAFLDAPGPVADGSRSLPSPVRGGLHLRLAAHGRLPPLDVDIRPGELVALTMADPTAAEAVVALLARRGDPGEGVLALDGEPFADLRLAELRAAVLVEGHDAPLFSGTVLDNVAVSDESRCQDQLDAVLRAAAADEVVGALPHGLETVVTERGVSLSGGQRQRLALARALAADPPVLVLHDPTTAVDAVTEAGIAQGLRAARGGRTTVVFTSSPPLLAAADRVVFVDGGRRARHRNARRACGPEPALCHRGAGVMSVDARLLLPTATRGETGRALGALLRPRRLLLATAASLLVARAGAGLVGPAVLGHIVDLVLSGRPAAAISGPVGLLAAVALLEGALAWLGPTVAAHATEPALAELRERVMERALHVPIGDLERAGSGDLVARVDGDVATVSEPVRVALPQVAAAGLTIGLTTVGLAVLDWRLALAGLCAAPIQLHTLRWYLPRSAPLYARERVAAGGRTQQLVETLGAAEVVRAYGVAGRHRQLVAERSRKAIELTLSATWLRTRFFARLNLAELVGLAAILATGFVLARSGAVTVGAVSAAALYFQRIFDPVNVLLYLADEVQAAGAALARLVGVASLPEGSEPGHHPAGAQVRLADVSYAYEAGHDVLHHVDLAIGDGEQVAVVGASGAGKSTIAKLVAGVLQPQGGNVTIGGAPVTGAGPTVGLVTQA